MGIFSRVFNWMEVVGLMAGMTLLFFEEVGLRLEKEGVGVRAVGIFTRFKGFTGRSVGGSGCLDMGRAAYFQAGSGRGLCLGVQDRPETEDVCSVPSPPGPFFDGGGYAVSVSDVREYVWGRVVLHLQLGTLRRWPNSR
jgi:hypothetical protein